MDWDGSFFVTYGLAAGVPNIIVIDHAGFVRYMYSGKASSEAIGQLFAVVDKMIKERL